MHVIFWVLIIVILKPLSSLLLICISLMINDIWHLFKYLLAFWRWFIGKESSCQCRRHNSIPGLRRFQRTGNGNPFHGLWSQTCISTHRCTIDLLCVFFGERSIQILYPFFKLSFFFFYWVLGVPYIFWILTLYWICGCKYFLPFHRLCFHFVVGFPSCTEAF